MSYEDIIRIHDINLLKDMKEKIKSQVVGNISWQDRMHMYQQIQFINERIKSLEPVVVS